MLALGFLAPCQPLMGLLYCSKEGTHLVPIILLFCFLSFSSILRHVLHAFPGPKLLFLITRCPISSPAKLSIRNALDISFLCLLHHFQSCCGWSNLHTYRHKDNNLSVSPKNLTNSEWLSSYQCSVLCSDAMTFQHLLLSRLVVLTLENQHHFLMIKEVFDGYFTLTCLLT